MCHRNALEEINVHHTYTHTQAKQVRHTCERTGTTESADLI